MILEKKKLFLLTIFFIINISAFCDEITHENFPPYEVGDIVCFGYLNTSVNKTGHVAILGPREKKEGDIWQVQLLDAMPKNGVKLNYNINTHGEIYKIITHNKLANGIWTAERGCRPLSSVAEIVVPCSFFIFLDLINGVWYNKLNYL